MQFFANMSQSGLGTVCCLHTKMMRKLKLLSIKFTESCSVFCHDTTHQTVLVSCSCKTSARNTWNYYCDRAQMRKNSKMSISSGVCCIGRCPLSSYIALYGKSPWLHDCWACGSFSSAVIKWNLEALEEGFCLRTCQEDYSSVQWCHTSSNSFGRNAPPSGCNVCNTLDFRSPHLLLDSGQHLFGFCASMRNWNKLTVNFWPEISSNYLLWKRHSVYEQRMGNRSVIKLCWQLDVFIYCMYWQKMILRTVLV